MRRPVFIGSEIYRHSSYGPGHPLAIARVSTVVDLSRALGWLPDCAYRDSPQADPEALAQFHDRGYIAAVQAAERDQTLPDQAAGRYNLGGHENPYFAEMFRRPATACGGSLLAARLLQEGAAGRVFIPAGGNHHARPAHAAGFCYFNDPVLAILALLRGGCRRVAYVDIDAHHGDGVEAAFADDRRVLTLSVHEADRWPLKRGVRQSQAATMRNVAVPRDFNDTEMDLVVQRVIVPTLRRFGAPATVMQCGADGLSDDPLSRLGLSNRAVWAAVKAVAENSQRLLLLGGGGYNPWSLARCWAGNWAVLNEFAIPDRLNPAAEAVLRRLTWNRHRGRPVPAHWFTTLADPPRPGPVRPETLAAIALALAPAGATA